MSPTESDAPTQSTPTEHRPPACSGGPVCSTVVDELLEGQLESRQVCSTVIDELLEAELRRGAR